MSLKPYEIKDYDFETTPSVEFYFDILELLEELKQEISTCYSLTLEEEPAIEELNQRLFSLLCDFEDRAIVKP